MWKLLSNDYFLKFSNTNKYKIKVTDVVSIWFYHCNEEQFYSALKASNVTLEIEKNELIEKGTQMLSTAKFTSTDITKVDGRLNISMAVFYGYPVKLKLTLNEGSKALFFHYVTKPLLQTVEDLRASEEKLKSLLKKKDDEIDEYKCEGGEIALRHLITVRFNEEEHMAKYNICWDEIGSLHIPASQCNEEDNLVEDNNQIKLENAINNAAMKSEPGTDSSISTSTIITGVNSQIKTKTECQHEVSSRKRQKKCFNY